MQLTMHRKLFLSHFLGIALVAGGIGWYFYTHAVSALTDNIRLRLESTAALIGQILDAHELDGIRTAADRERPEYVRNLELLRRLEHANADIAFLYAMRHEGGRVLFVLDSDMTSAQAEPGRQYATAPPEMFQGFVYPSVDAKTSTDEWGSFMSGYAPIRNGNGEYLIGVDMRASEVERQLFVIRLAALLSLGLGIVLAFALASVLSARMIAPVRSLMGRYRQMAGELAASDKSPKGKDEFDQLLEAFDAMSDRLAEARAQAEGAQEALRQARDQLEQRIAERTFELVEVNERLLREVAERARAEEMLAQSARSDPLTGLMNRRAMLEQLGYHAQRCERTGAPFVVMLGDLDHFKSINDRFGHDAGDEALVRVAECLVRTLRSQDLVARWGGEEILALLPDTDLAEGISAAERVRAAIGAIELPGSAAGTRLSISIGLAEHRSEATINTSIKSADIALYEAKGRGRDRVVVADEAQLTHV
jgi:diguanylate cyclase (GGDEF)-like protein